MYAKECLYIQDIFKKIEPQKLSTTPAMSRVLGAFIQGWHPSLIRTRGREHLGGRQALVTRRGEAEAGVLLWFQVGQVHQGTRSTSHHRTKTTMELFYSKNNSCGKNTSTKKTTHFFPFALFFLEFFRHFCAYLSYLKLSGFRAVWSERCEFCFAIISDPKNGCQIIEDKLLASFGDSKIGIFCFAETHWHRNQGALDL